MAASTSTSTSPSLMDHLDRTTITSLLAVVALLAAAYALSLYALPSPSKGPSKRQVTKHARPLFIWHVFDCLIHAIFEGSYLYNVFFSFSPYSPATSHPVSLQNFLGSPHRLYGAKYADPSNWASSLWMVYAQADRRWEGVNLTVVSLELLTVLVGGPLAAYVSWLIARGDWRMNFWIVVLATAEIYGGWMTFCPEWLTGSQNLDTSNFMFLYVYLWFFNGLWVVMPLYAMWVAYTNIKEAFVVSGKAGSPMERKKAV